MEVITELIDTVLTLRSMAGTWKCSLNFSHLSLLLLFLKIVIVFVQSLSGVQLFETLWTANARLPCPSLSPGVCSFHVH